jgi:diaminopimelate epimerase
MLFTKMQGLGNDYVYVDAAREEIADPSGLARIISDRHFGVGADGLILICPSDVADVRMQMFNADGSEAQMCGNGIRCVAKYAWDHRLTRSNPMAVETRAGIKEIQLQLGPAGLVESATVDMGEPILEAAQIPLSGLEGEKVVDQPLQTSEGVMKMTCVSMGNPHAVFYVDQADAVDLNHLGPIIENHPVFPERVNAHFVQVHSEQEVTVKTWERGSGITLACGTGASAVCVAGALTGRAGRSIVAHLPGGDLELQWRQDGHVLMTGPAVEVFQGEWPG